MSTPLLTVSGVSKRFGGLQALSEVELTIQPGQIHGQAVLQPQDGLGRYQNIKIGRSRRCFSVARRTPRELPAGHRP